MRIPTLLLVSVLLLTALNAKDKTDKLSEEAMRAKIADLQEQNENKDIALILVERTQFEKEAQARYTALTEKFQALMKTACAKKGFPLEQCQFDGNSRKVVRVEPPKDAPKQ